MKKNHYRRNKYNILTFLISVIVIFFLTQYNLINDKIVISDLVVFNSLFSSVLFILSLLYSAILLIVLGILVGLLDNEKIKYLDEGGYIDNYINSIYIGLFFSIITIISILIEYLFKISASTELFLYEFSQILFLLGFIFFIKSIFGIIKLKKYIRE